MKQEAFEVLLNRRAIRKFKPDPVPEDVLDQVLRAGTYAPTAMGRQSPVIIAVRDPAMVARVDALNGSVLGSSHPYYGAPVILLILYTDLAANEEIGIIDSAAVCTNLLNAAYAAGLGSCWIHRCKEMFATAAGKALLREWGLPENLRGVASIALGYADCDQPAPRPRKDGYVVKI